MKNYVWQIILLFSITLIVLTLYSFSNLNLKIGDIEIQNPGIKDALMGDTILPEALALVSLDEVKEKPVKMDSTKQKILLIGDSMLEGLMLRMKDYTDANGHELQPVIWYSSQTEWYGKSDTLLYHIRKFKPTYVVLVIGANELFVPKIREKRDKYVKRIVEQIDTLKFVWIGPPNWKDDTGINDMIVSNVGERRYFPSKNLTYKRTKDGAHPTHASSAIWMDSIASWIMHKSMYPILLNTPTEKHKGTPHAILIQPWK